MLVKAPMPYHKPIPEPNSRGNRSGAFQAWVQAEKFIQIILILPSAAFIGWLLGVWLDHAFHKTWISMAGVVVGIVAGLVSAVRMAVYYASKSDSENGTGGNSSGQS
jgi:F0F1-type ATP synthase assembly protein I